METKKNWQIFWITEHYNIVLVGAYPVGNFVNNKIIAVAVSRLHWSSTDQKRLGDPKSYRNDNDGDDENKFHEIKIADSWTFVFRFGQLFIGKFSSISAHNTEFLRLQHPYFYSFFRFEILVWITLCCQNRRRLFWFRLIFCASSISAHSTFWIAFGRFFFVPFLFWNLDR